MSLSHLYSHCLQRGPLKQYMLWACRTSATAAAFEAEVHGLRLATPKVTLQHRHCIGVVPSNYITFETKDLIACSLPTVVLHE